MKESVKEFMNDLIKSEERRRSSEKVIFMGIIFLLALVVTEGLTASLPQLSLFFNFFPLGATIMFFAYALPKLWVSLGLARDQKPDQKQYSDGAKTAYHLGEQSKDWVPYLKSYFHPQAYWNARAYAHGLADATRKDMEKELKEKKAKISTSPTC